MTSPILELCVAERHAVVAGHFSELVDATADWEAPTPVAGWTARDVVAHLTTWFPGFLQSGAAIELPPGAGDPVTAWQRQTRAIQEILDNPELAGRPFSHRHSDRIPVCDAIDQFYTPDVFMHTWDLARATGQPDDLDLDFCAFLLAGMEPFEEAMRSSGQYGQAVPVPSDADPQTRMLGFIGRDPFWSKHPPGAST